MYISSQVLRELLIHRFLTAENAFFPGIYYHGDVRSTVPAVYLHIGCLVMLVEVFYFSVPCRHYPVLKIVCRVD